ncbi:MAG: hypothetical protein ACI9CE_000527 [Flavobacterium sp.]|jgi:hypothetical protein
MSTNKLYEREEIKKYILLALKSQHGSVSPTTFSSLVVPVDNLAIGVAISFGRNCAVDISTQTQLFSIAWRRYIKTCLSFLACLIKQRLSIRVTYRFNLRPHCSTGFSADPISYALIIAVILHPTSGQSCCGTFIVVRRHVIE